MFFHAIVLDTLLIDCLGSWEIVRLMSADSSDVREMILIGISTVNYDIRE